MIEIVYKNVVVGQLAWRISGYELENTVEVSNCVKSALFGDLGDRKLFFFKQLNCGGDLYGVQIFDEAHSKICLKEFRKIGLAVMRKFRHFVECNGCVFLHYLSADLVVGFTRHKLVARRRGAIDRLFVSQNKGKKDITVSVDDVVAVFFSVFKLFVDLVKDGTDIVGVFDKRRKQFFVPKQIFVMIIVCLQYPHLGVGGGANAVDALGIGKDSHALAEVVGVAVDGDRGVTRVSVYELMIGVIV